MFRPSGILENKAKKPTPRQISPRVYPNGIMTE